jgi:methylated-DNA-[protein]-cysteine S-methyltransferase
VEEIAIINPRPYQVLIRTPIGDLGVHLQDDRLERIDFLGMHGRDEYGAKSSIAQLLKEYFHHPKTRLEWPLLDPPTSFQQRFRQALLLISAGKVVTYGELAKQLQTSPRALAQACRANPVPLIVPCHRVVAHNGLGGFSGSREGWPLTVKRWLLTHEGVEGYREDTALKQ